MKSFKHGKQPRFGILRPLGDFTGGIKDSNLNYDDLWKHDEYIHTINIIEDKDLPVCPTPISRGFFGIRKIHPDEQLRYQRELDKYNEAIEKNERAKSLLVLHDEIKRSSDHKCHFCGFFDEYFLEIHHLDDNHFNNSKDNLVPACTLCHRQHHLLWLSLYDHAELGVANVSDFPQTEFNHMQRISLVMKDHPKYGGQLGSSGKLGTIISQIAFNFARPLHSFMIPNKEKETRWQSHIASKDVENIQNGNFANYSLLELALDNMDSSRPSKSLKSAIDAYDHFIDLSGAKKLEPNATESDIRTKNRMIVREAMVKYEKDYQIEFEKHFRSDKSTFSIFELAMALKTIDYAQYVEFQPNYMYLIFKESIFTPEQIEYYKQLEYFNVDKWTFGGR